MVEEKKFLRKFPIIDSSGYDLYRRVVVGNLDKSYTVDVIFNCFQRQLDISCTISHEEIDRHLVPRLLLVRDIYNQLVRNLKNEKPKGEVFGESFLDLAFSKRVLPPKFYLSLDQQATLKEIKAEINAEEFADIYSNLVNRICDQYDIQNIRTEKDWLHEERIILPVARGYTFEMTKPTGFIQTFEIHADNNVDYTKLPVFSEAFRQLAKESLGEKIKVYDNDELTNCNFRISLDISVPERLTAAGIEQKLLE
jgi:hypothetical protein